MSFNIVFRSIIGILLALSVFSAQAKDYKEGQDYEIRSANRTVKPEIREFFSFYCSHCFSLSSTFESIKESFKGKADFIANPVGIIGGDLGVESQKAYAVALNMGIEDDLAEALFERIHQKNEIPESHEYFVQTFESLGVPADRFESEYRSFVTNAKISEYDRNMSAMKIEAVPEIVVNGKYLVLTKNLESVEDYKNLIAYLLTLP
ncbi:MAG: thiol:disulfide interchange protein DsbA/DsbL [Succinivibrio sp.]